MTAKSIKLWLVGAGLLMVIIRLVWIQYSEIGEERCVSSGGTWSAEAKSCETAPPAAAP
jgi:hypothetical protein